MNFAKPAISDSAWEAADRETEGVEQRSAILARGLVAAAPFIIADELELIAKQLEGGLPVDRDWLINSFRNSARLLRERAL